MACSSVSAFDLIIGGDPALYAIIGLSLTVSISAALLAAAIGLPLGALLNELDLTRNIRRHSNRSAAKLLAVTCPWSIR
jgi:ABC-type tungstate transport system substrate-binding protein